MPDRRHPLRVYAHRGASAEAPENTLPSFQRALELGVDALELDVHLTRDRAVLVSHDPTAARMAGVAAAWRDLDLADVRRLDAGWGFVAPDGTRPFAGAGVGFVTLDELLAELPPVVLNIDLKQHTPSMVDEVLAVVRRRRAADRVVLASFHLRTLREVRRKGYEGPTALSQPEVAALALLPGAVVARLPLGDCAQVPVAAGPITLAGPRVLARCRAVGLRVDVWTVNAPAEAERLLAIGVDGLMTDDPRTIAPVVAAWRARQG